MAKSEIRGLLVALTFVAAFSNISCTVTIDAIPSPNAIEEGATSGEVVTVTATTDTENASIATFAVTSPATNFEFATPNTGALTVKSGNTIDYETATTQVIVFTVVDSVQDTAKGTLTVSITDINDNTPLLETKTFSVADGAEASTTVGTVTATDADGTAPNNEISTYVITGGNNGTMFAISNTGVITVETGKNISAATLESYALVVTATDSGTPPLTGTGTVNIAVSDAPLISGGIVSVAAMLMTIIYQFI